jgi:hypothetical protein
MLIVDSGEGEGVGASVGGAVVGGAVVGGAVGSAVAVVPGVDLGTTPDTVAVGVPIVPISGGDFISNVHAASVNMRIQTAANIAKNDFINDLHIYKLFN